MTGDPVSQKANKAAQSYVGWLTDAGADMLVEDAPTSWLETPEEKPVAAEPATQSDNAPPPGRKGQPPVQAKDSAILPPSDWPDDIAALRGMLQAGAKLPGNHYGGKNIVVGDAEVAKFMLVLDLPEREDIQTGSLASGAQGVLLSNMMTAVGAQMADCYVTALAFTRPATGMLPEDDLPLLAQFLAYQVSLLKPQQLILFGSSVSSALFGAELMNARRNLQDFNHKGQNVASLTTFHPRTLLARPQMKAQAWKDLQMLSR